MRNIVRNVLAALACTSFVAGCAGTADHPIDAAMTEPPPNVTIYDVQPPSALVLGPVSATACDGTQEMATRQLQVMVAKQGGNGLSQLKCRDAGMSLACWKQATCEGTALNVPPPPPPPAKKRPRKKRA